MSTDISNPIFFSFFTSVLFLAAAKRDVGRSSSFPCANCKNLSYLHQLINNWHCHCPVHNSLRIAIFNVSLSQCTTKKKKLSSILFKPSEYYFSFYFKCLNKYRKEVMFFACLPRKKEKRNKYITKRNKYYFFNQKKIKKSQPLRR
jgi:hypothetical protein